MVFDFDHYKFQITSLEDVQHTYIIVNMESDTGIFKNLAITGIKSHFC